jgi:hypothetical protein|eukprot:COSAG01_NODE_4310_length_5142_cov_14.830855_6_plen_70_part_00
MVPINVTFFDNLSVAALQTVCCSSVKCCRDGGSNQPAGARGTAGAYNKNSLIFPYVYTRSYIHMPNRIL